MDILILSNGPGEVTTWVKPVVKALRQKLGDNRSLVRISVVLSPCPNATGKEAEIARSYPEVDRVQSAEHFFRFLLWGVTADNWDWHNQGVVVFLGGDQIFPVIIGFRLGYPKVIYAEWDTRWHRWIDRFGVMKPEIITKAPQKYSHKFAVVGDLMADVGRGTRRRGDGETRRWGDEETREDSRFPSPLGRIQGGFPNSQTTIPTELIGLLPGSKSAKLTQGVPLALAIAEYIYAKRPQTRFVIPVAPTLDLDTLASFADPQQNSLIHQLGWGEAKAVIPTDSPEISPEVSQSPDNQQEKEVFNSPPSPHLPSSRHPLVYR